MVKGVVPSEVLSLTTGHSKFAEVDVVEHSLDRGQPQRGI